MTSLFSSRSYMAGPISREVYAVCQSCFMPDQCFNGLCRWCRNFGAERNIRATEYPKPRSNSVRAKTNTGRMVKITSDPSGNFTNRAEFQMQDFALTLADGGWPDGMTITYHGKPGVIRDGVLYNATTNRPMSVGYVRDKATPKQPSSKAAKRQKLRAARVQQHCLVIDVGGYGVLTVEDDQQGGELLPVMWHGKYMQRHEAVILLEELRHA